MKEKDTEKQLKALEEAVRQEQETGGKTAKKHRESSSAAAKESHPLASFLIGLVLLGAGIFWVLNSFVVSFSWGSLWGGFGINEGLAVDTHVKRISGRLGLTKHTDPVDIEKDLVKLFPQSEWGKVNHRMVWFGRHVCDARKPLCDECEMASFCPKVGVE